MKATDVIRRDHEAAKALFEKYQKANQEDHAAMEEKIFKALDTHEKMEDTYFYPALEETLNEDAALADLEREQGELETEVAGIKAMNGDKSEALKAAMDNVLAHAKKEEAEILPKAEQTLSAEKLEELGAQMEPQSAVANDKG